MHNLYSFSPSQRRFNTECRPPLCHCNSSVLFQFLQFLLMVPETCFIFFVDLHSRQSSLPLRSTARSSCAHFPYFLSLRSSPTPLHEIRNLVCCLWETASDLASQLNPTCTLSKITSFTCSPKTLTVYPQTKHPDVTKHVRSDLEGVKHTAVLRHRNTQEDVHMLTLKEETFIPRLFDLQTDITLADHCQTEVTKLSSLPPSAKV